MATNGKKSEKSFGAGKIADLSWKLDLRKRATRRKRIIRGLIWALVAVLIGVLVWLVGFSDVFVAKSVEVKGNELVLTEEVVEVADVPLGIPLAQISMKEIERRILRLPAVKSVSVSRKWPNTVSIKVAERERVYQRLEGNIFQWVDEDGYIFYSQSQSADGAISVVTEGTDQRLLSDVAVVVQAIPESWASRVQRIEALSPDMITIVLDQGQDIFWGSATDSELKAEVTTALLNVKATHFDVSSPGNPTSR